MKSIPTHFTADLMKSIPPHFTAGLMKSISTHFIADLIKSIPSHFTADLMKSIPSHFTADLMKTVLFGKCTFAIYYLYNHRPFRRSANVGQMNIHKSYFCVSFDSLHVQIRPVCTKIYQLFSYVFRLFSHRYLMHIFSYVTM